MEGQGGATVSEHTPGPFEVRTYDHLKSYEIRSPHRHWPIARVMRSAGRGPLGISEGEAEANARLIAAAPDYDEVAGLIVAYDWAGLIEWAKAHDCLPDRYDAADPETYEWEGDFETDARHTYPARQRLVEACLSACIDKARGEAGR